MTSRQFQAFIARKRITNALTTASTADEKADLALSLVNDGKYGMFWDTTTQTAAAINTAYAVTYNSSSLASADPDFANVSLLLHMNGTNGSTTFLDSSVPAKTVTAFGNAQISTAQSKFGGASALFDGLDDYLSTPQNSVFAFPGDFTVECWVYLLSGNGTGNRAFCLSPLSGDISFGLTGAKLQFGAAFVAFDVTSSSNVPTNAWVHVAASRSGSNLRLFIDGIQDGAATQNRSYTNAGPLYIGGRPTAAAESINGYIDEMRITKDVARYTANFTPPAAPFPDGAYSQNLNQGVVLRSPSEVQVVTGGVYSFQHRMQLDKTSTGSANAWFWWRVNGVNVPQSASQIQVQSNNAETIATANTLLDLNDGQYAQLMWAVSDTSVQLQSTAATGPVPAIPSVVLTAHSLKLGV
jgi:hypothetical protein